MFELQQHRRKTSVFVLLVFLLFAMCALDGLADLASVQGVAVNNVKNERPKGGRIIVRHADSIVDNENVLLGVQIFIGHVEFF